MLITALAILALAGIATAQTPEQEIEAEAMKMLPALFSKCGEDHFSKQIFKHSTETGYAISQYKGLSIRIFRRMVSTRDASHGVEWHGDAQFTAKSSRDFAHGIIPRDQRRGPEKPPAWGRWRPAHLTAYRVAVEKRNGVIAITRRPAGGVTAIPCDEVPPG